MLARVKTKPLRGGLRPILTRAARGGSGSAGRDGETAPRPNRETPEGEAMLQSCIVPLATAIFGIRFQGDFGGDAIRSQSAANALRTIDEDLQGGVTLPRAADLVEEAARLMLGHLDEWRLINQQRDLSVG